MGRAVSYMHIFYLFKMLDLVTLTSRSSHQRCSVKRGVLKSFTKFKGKHLCQGLYFNKVAGLRPATLLKKRLWHRCFPVNFVKVQEHLFVTEHHQTDASEYLKFEDLHLPAPKIGAALDKKECCKSFVTFNFANFRISF